MAGDWRSELQREWRGGTGRVLKRGRGKPKIKGLLELVAKLRDLGAGPTLDAISYKGTLGAAKDLRDEAKINLALALEAPPDSGAMMRAISVKKIKRGTQRGYTVGMRAGPHRRRSKHEAFMGPLPTAQAERKRSAAADDAYYWTFIEFGTRYIQPRKFLRNAIRTLMPGPSITTIQKAGTKAVLSAGNSALRKFGNGT